PPGATSQFYGTPWIDGSYLYTSAGNSVYSLDATPGGNNPGWPAGGTSIPGAGMPLVLSDYHASVYVSGSNGSFFKLDLSTGVPTNQLTLQPGFAVSDPTYDWRRNAFYVTSNGVLYSINGNW